MKITVVDDTNESSNVFYRNIYRTQGDDASTTSVLLNESAMLTSKRLLGDTYITTLRFEE